MFDNENTFKDYPDILSFKQLMEILQLGKSKSYELIRGHKIEAIKIVREYKIPKQSLIKYLNSVVAQTQS